ncbi:unnamed protein product [Closterium sp. NIES-53]
MDAEMASWKSTGTYVDEVPPPGANIVSGMWIFMVKRPPGCPPIFKGRYVARGFSQRQGVDFFQTFSPTPKMTTLRWHDTLRTTLATLGFAPSTADPSLILRTDTTLTPFYVLVYVDDLVFATADTEALAHVKSELQKRHTCIDLGELTSYLGLRITRDRAQRTITLTQAHMVQQVLQRFGFTYSSPQSTPLPTGHSLSAPPSDESVEPSGPYPELVGCLMYLMTCTRPDLAYPLSLLTRNVAPGRYRKELRWLTYLLTDLGEAPRSPPVLYVDNKAMLALCQEHRLEHRTKHIALRYFLARELQQRGQLRLAYVASRANTANVFTKALQSCDHQLHRFLCEVEYIEYIELLIPAFSSLCRLCLLVPSRSVTPPSAVSAAFSGAPRGPEMPRAYDLRRLASAVLRRGLPRTGFSAQSAHSSLRLPRNGLPPPGLCPAPISPHLVEPPAASAGVPASVHPPSRILPAAPRVPVAAEARIGGANKPCWKAVREGEGEEGGDDGEEEAEESPARDEPTVHASV